MWMKMNENIKSWRYLNRKLKGAENSIFKKQKKSSYHRFYHKKYKIIGQITTNIHSTNFINIFFNFLRTTWYFSISISYKIYFLRKWDSEKTKQIRNTSRQHSTCQAEYSRSIINEFLRIFSYQHPAWWKLLKKLVTPCQLVVIETEGKINNFTIAVSEKNL